jgi:hypothetical protein
MYMQYLCSDPSTLSHVDNWTLGWETDMHENTALYLDLV